MALPALEDIAAHSGVADPIPGLTRIETSPREKATPIIMEMIHSVYEHDEVFGQFCTVNDFIDCPPDKLFDYLADTRCLEEWTYSLRGFTHTHEPGLWRAYDRLGSETEIYTRTVANREAGTVDYHCAWDQGKHLWMIYLMRVVDAQAGAQQARLGGAVDQLPSPVLRPTTLTPKPPRRSARSGLVTSGTCSARAICWN